MTMGIIRAVYDAVGGTFGDQWKDIVTAEDFDEHTLVSPGIVREKNRWRGSNTRGSDDIISAGSKIFIPENTAMFVFGEGGIEEVVFESGNYVYEGGPANIFDSGMNEAIFQESWNRIQHGGIPSQQKRVAFVNLREIRNIKFGTKGPQLYHDNFYDSDLELQSYGAFSIIVTDAIKLMKNFVPPGERFYSVDSGKAKAQLTAEFLQSFISAVNSLSSEHRISALPSKVNEITGSISAESANAGTWEDRFGIRITGIAIEKIELTEESRKIVMKYNKKKMDVSAFEDVSARASDISARQKMAEGVRKHGFGDGGGLIFGMDMAREAARTYHGTVEEVEKGGAYRESDSTGYFAGDGQGSGIPGRQGGMKSDWISELREMKALVEEGILTDEEFSGMKKDLLEKVVKT